ncbi:adenine-specific methyltransferase EcoRI family protein [Mycoplasmopsis agassizii]|uniref:adenine-specific methyltransferase EcoRI family protein n=1 Tax=Mycoplasmopsis agassizii TaxID=33922 RepID=UPI0009D7B2EE|nr:adenine-specific methyltransferase EcoRI family protein [Mycoplasmopsis agassizii]SMC19709.1 Adenine-specific methyltransferase EcoRI [Mycoplasmopsis agassizii]
MGNENLSKAKNSKNDEFYTQYDDIQNEINFYHAYDPNVFRNKTIFLPCDDPEWSDFTKFFVTNFEKYGLKKLISTSYAYTSKKVNFPYQQLLFDFEKESPQFDYDKSVSRGKIFTLTKDTSNKKIDYDDLKWDYLEGDGDFRSQECVDLIKEADIVITNPPFSLFRQFIEHIFKYNKKFLIIGSKNVISYKEIFPLIRDNHIWLGRTSVKKFMTISENGKEWKQFGNIGWFTNIEHGARYDWLKLLTMEENLIYDKRLIKSVREAAQRSNYHTLSMITIMQ